MLAIAIIMTVLLGIFILLYSYAFLEAIMWGPEGRDWCMYFGGLACMSFIITGTWLLYCHIPA